jgi:uncharacterized protein (UPF0303 family)
LSTKAQTKTSREITLEDNMQLPNDQSGWLDLYESVLAEESAIDFDQFSYDDAWDLGNAMASTASAQALPVAMAIHFGEQKVFHRALSGASATNDDWLTRKFRAVAKHNCSSFATACKQWAGDSDYFTEGGYDRAFIALAGGAVPLRVRGSLIGAVGVSGLAGEDDHRFVIDALTVFGA